MRSQPPPNYTPVVGQADQEHQPKAAQQGQHQQQEHAFYEQYSDVRSPLLERAGAPGAAPAGPGVPLGYPADYPNDFIYGVDVKSSGVSVQMDFVRKVYSILCVQLFASMLMGTLMLSSTQFQIWAWNNSWALIVSIIMTFVSLGLVFWKRHSVPANYALLCMFTFFESYMIGNTIAYFDTKVVLQAVIITTGVVLALTLFTFQTKWDFSGMGPWLTGGIFLLILVSFVQIFFPFNRTLDLFIAIGTALVFIGFILYDTQNLFKMSPEEYIAASITLYLDVINLFLAILRILQYVRDDN